MRVLYLSAWYPTERDQMSGLFVRKHKEAVERQGVDVRVAYNEEKSAFRSLMMLWRQVKNWRKEGWIPDVVQVNVLNKNALIAYWLKKRYNIPYIIVEHWSGYLPQNFSIRGGWHLKLMKTLAREASCILPVSQRLKCAIMDCGIDNDSWQVIQNVVDDFFYAQKSPKEQSILYEQAALQSTSPNSVDKIRLLHVSCFDEKAKNVKGLLRAVRKVAETRQDFVLTLVGTGVDWADDKAYAESLLFPNGMLIWTGEQTPHEVCRWMQQSDAFLLFSRYENAPVVLSECLAVGLPIVTSRVGGIPEMVNDTCAIQVDSENEAALADSIIRMLDHYQEYQRDAIRELGKKYALDMVGRQLMNVYARI